MSKPAEQSWKKLLTPWEHPRDVAARYVTHRVRDDFAYFTVYCGNNVPAVLCVPDTSADETHERLVNNIAAIIEADRMQR